MATGKPVHILLVEDNLGDITLVTEALSDNDVQPVVHNVRDGVEAMMFLSREAPFHEAPRPALVILDLNLPRKNGRVVLEEIKSDPDLTSIPVVVFSGSDAPQDISACYALHANCYIVKPRDLPGLTETIGSLVDFWLKRVAFPPEAVR